MNNMNERCHVLDNGTDIFLGKNKQLTPENFMSMFRYHIRYTLGLQWNAIDSESALRALSLTVRDLLIDKLLDTEKRYSEKNPKRVYYLSMELFLMNCYRS